MKELLEELIDLFKRNFQSNLTGIYLHGSLDEAVKSGYDHVCSFYGACYKRKRASLN